MWDVLFALWQHDQDKQAEARQKEENDRFLRELNEATARQEAIERRAIEEENRLKKEEEEKARKEEEARLKAIEDERLSTVWTAQNVLQKLLKDKNKNVTITN